MVSSAIAFGIQNLSILIEYIQESAQIVELTSYLPVQHGITRRSQVRVLPPLGNYFNFIYIDCFNPNIKALRKVMKLMEEATTWLSRQKRHAAG